MKIKMDKIDNKILTELQANGRITNAELATTINLSESACLRRIRRLEHDGLIKGYTALIDAHKMGLTTSVFVEVSLKSQSEKYLDAFEAAVAACPNVMGCYLMSGEFDYMIRVTVTDTEDYERIHKQYLAALPGVARIKSNFSLRTVLKRTAIDFNALTNPPA